MTARRTLFGRWLLLGLLALSAALDLAQEVVTRRAYDAGVSGIETVSDNTIPSVRHLAEVRRAVRRVFTELVIQDLDRTEAGRRFEARWTVIDAHLRAYLALPHLPAEAALRPQLVDALDRARAAERRWVEAGATGDAVADELQRQLYVAADAALDTLDIVVGENARGAAEAADAVLLAHARASGLSVVLLLGVLAAFTTAGVIAFQVLRRAELEVARRLEELDAFAGRVAHDLKSPLHPALLGVGVLRREPLPERAVAYLDRVERSLRRAAALVDGLLAFARSGARPVAGARARLGDVARELEPALRQLAAEERAALVLDLPDVELAADPAAVSSIIDNLARNALLYLGPADRREVRVRGIPRGDLLDLEVTDTGPGIPSDVLRRLFRPFERGSDRPGGSGLGLATVQRLVHAHGGTIAVSSQVGQGATFRVRLPLRRA